MDMPLNTRILCLPLIVSIVFLNACASTKLKGEIKEGYYVAPHQAFEITVPKNSELQAIDGIDYRLTFVDFAIDGRFPGYYVEWIKPYSSKKGFVNVGEALARRLNHRVMAKSGAEVGKIECKKLTINARQAFRCTSNIHRVKDYEYGTHVNTFIHYPNAVANFGIVWPKSSFDLTTPAKDIPWNDYEKFIKSFKPGS